MVLSGGRDGGEPPLAIDDRRDRFMGPYERRILPEVGHCVPAEAPLELAANVEGLLRMPEQ